MRACALLAIVGLAGCAREPTMPLYENALPQSTVVAHKSGIRVTRVGVFADDLAYGDRRGVYLIEDDSTGSKFIGVSGVGISELGVHQVGKVRAGDER